MGRAAITVRGQAELIAAAPTGPGRTYRVLRQRDAPPVAWRATPEAVYLVSTAATPAGDDVVGLDVSVQPHARLLVRSTAATIAWRSSGTAQRIRASVADGGSLDWHLEPLIATRGCCHEQHVSIELQGSARLTWTEELVLGRALEQPGHLDLRLDVELDGRPLLRHQMVVGSGDAWDGPAILGRHRTAGITVSIAAEQQQASPASGAGWARLPLEGPGILALAVGDELPELRVRLGQAGWTVH
jgi:urease accessory protein